MRKIWTKSVAVTATTGALVLGMAGMASADTGDRTETDVDQTETHVEDVADVSLNDILNGSLDVGDLASGNNVLNGVDADVNDLVNDILSGNDSDVDVDPDVDTDTDVDADTDASSDSSQAGDDEGGLLGLLN